MSRLASRYSLRAGFRLGLFFLALAALLPATGAAAGPDRQEAEIQFAQGLYALNEADYHEAYQRFRTAHQQDPGEARHLFYLALTENRLGRYAEAGEHLAQVEAMRPDLPGLPYEQGLRAMGQERWEEALGHLEEARRRQPRRGEVYLSLGVVHERMGNTSEAMSLYEKAQLLDPSLADQVSFFRGRTYLQDGMVDLARKEFQASVDSPNDYLNRLSADYLERMEVAREGPPQRWDFTGWFALAYDDNVVLNPDDPGLSTVSDEEDVRAVAYAAVRYRPWVGRHGMFGLGLGMYRSNHQDLDEYDLFGVTPEVEYRWQNDKALFRALGRYGTYERDGDDYLDFSEVEVRAGFRNGNSGRTEFIVAYRDEDFEFDERDGDEASVGVEQFFYPWKNKRRYASALILYTDHDAGNDFERVERGVGAKLYSPLAGAWDLSAALYFTDFDYDNVHGFFQTMREDEEWKLVLRSSYDIKEWLALVLEYRGTEHESNIPYFDYDRQVFTVGILARP